MDEAKVRLQFIFKNLSTPSGDDEVTNCIAAGLVVQDSLCAISVRNIKFYIELDAYITSLLASKHVLKQKYLEDRLSMRDIANEFSCSKTRIRSLLLKYEIPLREQNKYHKDHWRIYGKRRTSGKAVDHQRELRTIAAIKKMYAEGIGTAAIARLLDTMKIPTKRQGKGWDHSTVTAILRREGVYMDRGRRAALVSS